ncbi:hypothetical protein HMPREF0580_1262 [Mobiluncus mulieris ATCC 35239]|uniref:Uncharacterized protein n=1 Tax=Mobiluncus mulieris ATCC 35239 TaxID=871571 RepID=E0QQU7_9ACTO|nr:hypothetical protein HMPREF0580_1262 [Mobiluncus mulieris ATCC 35239]
MLPSLLSSCCCREGIWPAGLGWAGLVGLVGLPLHEVPSWISSPGRGFT